MIITINFLGICIHSDHYEQSEPLQLLEGGDEYSVLEMVETTRHDPENNDYSRLGNGRDSPPPPTPPIRHSSKQNSSSELSVTRVLYVWQWLCFSAQVMKICHTFQLLEKVTTVISSIHNRHMSNHSYPPNPSISGHADSLLIIYDYCYFIFTCGLRCVWALLW